MIFIIEDERHAEPQGEFSSIQNAIAELTRRAKISWDQVPNRAPCMSWKTCGRAYELIEYDDTHSPWKELRRVAVLEVSASGIKWSPGFENEQAPSAATQSKDIADKSIPTRRD
jgi:hypothetical protein